MSPTVVGRFFTTEPPGKPYLENSNGALTPSSHIREKSRPGCNLFFCNVFNFSIDPIDIFRREFIYSAVLGLSWGTQELCCIMQDLLL